MLGGGWWRAHGGHMEDMCWTHCWFLAFIGCDKLGGAENNAVSGPPKWFDPTYLYGSNEEFVLHFSKVGRSLGRYRFLFEVCGIRVCGLVLACFMLMLG